MTQNFVLGRILEYLNMTNPDTVPYLVAKGILIHLKEIPTITIHELAEKSYVSSASVHRFVKKIGFKNYKEFKNACKSDIDINVDYSAQVLKAQASDVKKIFEQYTIQASENLQYNLSNLDYEQLIRVCDRIYSAEKVIYLGLEFAMILGQHFQKKLAECNCFVQLPMTYEQQMKTCQELDQKSVVIIASLELGFLYRNEELLNILRENHVPIIVITMEKDSKLVRDFNEVLPCSQYNSETEGRIGLLHLLELLIMMYYMNYKK